MNAFNIPKTSIMAKERQARVTTDCASKQTYFTIKSELDPIGVVIRNSQYDRRAKLAKRGMR